MSSGREVEAELEYLREENRLLRESASFFGELSERLNAQLHKKRAHQHGSGGALPIAAPAGADPSRA